MTDITQGQDAPDAAPADKPDVDTLFGTKDVDDLFPSNYKAPDPVNHNASPLHDYIFSSPLHAPSRVLDAFGYGFKQDWGAGNQSLSEADEYLRKAGVYNDYAKGQRNIIKAANEAIMRPAVSAILAAKSVMGGVMHGAQEAVVKAGEEAGAPNLAREVAAVPEAFPTGFHGATGTPRFGEMPHTITQAKELNVIGAGEAGYFGTKAVEAELPAVAAHDAKVEGAAQAEGLPGHDAEAGPSPVAKTEAPASEAASDIHAVARQIAPDTFHEFDALAQKKDTFRRWISELRETRDADAATNAPHQAEIADLQGKLEGATPRLAKKYNERLEPLIAERDAYIEDRTRADSADMAKVRQQLMETDYRMRDLAPDVSKAYRDAEVRVPQQETVEVPAVEAHTQTPAAREAVPEGPEPVKPGHIRFYHGTAYSDASGFTGKTFVTPHYHYARDYHGGPNNVLYTDLSHELADARGLIDEVNRYPINGPIDDGAAVLKPMKPPAAETAKEAAAAPKTETPAVATKPEAPAAVAETKPKTVATSPGDVTAQLPIAHAPSIVADVSQKLKAAGRPAEEADAAAQIVAAYWETRAQRFEGAKGTAAEMYARATPDIVAGKEKPSKVKKARELELAQDRTTETPEFKSWFKDSHVTDDSGFPLVVYHGSNRRFSEFKPTEGFRQDEHGNKHGVTSNAFFFAPDKETARAYANNQVGVDKNLRGGTGGRANVQPYYLSVQQPLDFVITPEAWKYIQEEGEFFVRPNEPNPYTAGDIERITGYAPQTWREVQQALDDPRVIQELKKDGFDGVRLAEQDGSEAWAVFDPTQVKSTTKNTGEFNPKNPNVYHQGIQGRIRVRDEGRNTITLMKTADASTFIHETGHDWLDRMLKDSKDEAAPEVLKNDAQSVLKWLGADSHEAIKTSHHEKFARGFETYIMEGRAPSSVLARVFAKFKDWLTTIYKTVKALKSPISDDIRGVFDRLLAEKPEKTVIAPERETPSGLTEKHGALVESTPPERAHGVANTIEAERDSHAAKNLVENGDNDTRFADTGAETEGRAPGSAQSSGDADAAGAVGGETETAGGPGGIGEGGSEVASESARPRKESERLVKGPTPLLNFLAAQGGIKASDALISDLRQSLGGNNRYIPGFGQLIRTPKQLSSAAAKAGRLEAMSIDRAREAAIEQGLVPEGTTVAQFLDAIDDEVKGTGRAREIDAAEHAHQEHSFLEGLNDKVKEAGGSELSDAERSRALELYNKEGLHDPADIIERLALEADDAEIARGAPERAPGISGWDEPAPGWDTFDDRPDARGPLNGAAAAQPGEPRGATARSGSEAKKLDATSDLPKPDTQLVDKAGNIRLDNLGTPEDVNAVIRATAEANDDFNAARRNVIPDSEVLALAEALGMGVEQLSQRKLGQAFNAEQIVAARKLLIKSAGDVRDAAAKIAGGTEADVMAYAQARARHLMIQEQVSGITAEAGRALRAFRDLGGSKEAADLSAFLQNTQGKTLYQMKEEGALLAMMGTPQQVSKAVHDASLTRWQKTRAGILSWFINDLISGPITHAGYTVGNTVTQLFKATVDTSIAAAYGAFRDLPPGERVYFAEVGAQLYGMVRGMRDGYSPAITALKTGVPYMKGDVGGMIGQIEAAHRPQAIPGQVGYVLETPSRAVTAIHTMHYSMNYEAEIARRAFRSAMKDELEPGTAAFNTKIAEFTQSPPATEMEAAHNEALKMVLMKSAQFGTAQYHLQRAVNSNILAKIVMPFMQVGANILHESFIERTPLGLVSQTVRDNLTGKNGEVARHSQASRIAVGIGISTAVIGLTSEGILTGGGPSDHKQLAIKEMTGWRPYSIKVGESYVPYRKYLGGLGPLIAGTADIYEVGHTLSEEGLTKAAAGSLFGFAEVIADESWAKGLSNFIDAARHWDRDGSRYLRNIAADFIPFSIGLQQISTVSDPYRREVRTMLDSARAHIPGMSQGLFPVRDIWGEPIESHTALGPSHVNNDPATKALLDAAYYPGKLERKIRGVELTDQQYDDFTRLAGRMARMRVNALVNTPGFAQLPQTIRKQKLEDVISNPENGAREIARGMILMQSMQSDNNIVVKANQAKLLKRTGTPAKPETVH